MYEGLPLACAERFDPECYLWEGLPPMGCMRERASTAAMGGRWYVCGGADGDGCLRSAERFDLERNFWEALPPMGAQRLQGSAAAIGGRLYVFVHDSMS